MTELLTIIVSAAVGAIVAYLGAIWQTRLEARRFIHEKIFENRARLYPKAWQITGQLPLRPPTEILTREDLADLAIELRNWYYSEGGIFLSGGARRAYSECQDIINEIIQPGKNGSDLTKEQYEKARKGCSLFRTWLTRDLLSRSRAPMGGKWNRPST